MNGLPSKPCDAAVRADLAAAAKSVREHVAGSDVGVVVISRDDPACTAAVNGDETFGSASVVKLMIAIQVLRANHGDDPLATHEVETMLAVSDDGLASSFWAHYGKTHIVTETVSLLGLQQTTPPDDNPWEWGSTRTSASDVARIYRYILDDAPPYVRAPILTGTGGAERHAADGFDQYFGIPDGLPGATWWIKQGWGTSSGRRLVNTTGLVGKKKDSIVVLLSSYPLEVSYSDATEAVTEGIGELAPALGEA